MHDTSGPAFPETRWDDKTRQEVQWTGLTKREWFAGMALMGLCANPNRDAGVMEDAEASYQQADAMIAAGKVKS